MEDTLSQCHPIGTTGGECLHGTSLGELQHSRRIIEQIPAEIRRPRDPFHSPGDFRERVEEVPEGGAVSNCVIDGAADEDAVREFRYLDCQQGAEVALVADNAVRGEGEEAPDGLGHVDGGEDFVADGEMVGGGVDEVYAGVVAGDEDVPGGGVGGEAAGEGREMGEGVGEGAAEVGEESSVGRERRRSGWWEKDALLDVVAGEHGEV